MSGDESPSVPKTTLQRLIAAAPSRPLIGSNLISGGPEWTELCGNAGLDFVCVDQMVNAMSWQETNEMLRGAAAGGTSGWTRLSAYPWGGQDQRAFLQRDVLKAIAIGAEAILVSVDNARDAAALAEMPKSHVRHRKYSVRGRDAPGIVPEGLPSIVPLVESNEALDNLAEFASLMDVEAIFLGVGDLARLKGITADATTPELASILKDAVAVCSDHGVATMCSTGRCETLSDVLHRIDVLREIGLKFIWMPNPSHLTFAFYKSIVESIA